MTTQSPSSLRDRSFRRWPWRAITAAITTFVAVGAYYGSWYLISGPAASELQFPAPEFLPGDAWTAGGWALLVIVALPMTVVAVTSAVGSSSAPQAALVAGTLLNVWIVVQVALIGLVFFLQPVMFGFGALVVALGIWGRR